MVRKDSDCIFDYAQRAEGRGFYLCAEAACVKRASKYLKRDLRAEILSGLSDALSRDFKFCLRMNAGTYRPSSVDTTLEIVKDEIFAGMENDNIEFHLPVKNEFVAVNGDFPRRDKMKRDLQAFGKLSAEGL